MKAATFNTVVCLRFLKFQSTPPVKAATDKVRPSQISFGISIHAAREGGDAENLGHDCNQAISIHAAREGGDTISIFPFDFFFISIHAAREGGDRSNRRRKLCRCISIHAAREGGDVSPPIFEI